MWGGDGAALGVCPSFQGRVEAQWLLTVILSEPFPREPHILFWFDVNRRNMDR